MTGGKGLRFLETSAVLGPRFEKYSLEVKECLEHGSSIAPSLSVEVQPHWILLYILAISL